MAQPATRNLGRLSEIAQVAVRHGFGYWFDTNKLRELFPRRGPRVELDGQPSQRGQHLREMLDELGPTFVKFGQLLSTRPDVVPEDIVVELQKLQDEVRPFPYEDVERVIREDLGLSVEQLFTDFDPEPVAAASIGQVHRATLPNGRDVAVVITDISSSGVAIKTELRPEIGTPVTIGKTAGRVVRHLGEGFAIEFNRVLPLDFVEQNVTGL